MHSSPRVLIVDDDTSVRTLLGEVVKRDGGTPVLAANGVEGYAHLVALRTEISVILLDLSMPEMDGFKFRETQLEDAELAQIPVIVLTGFQLTSSELSFMKPAAVLSKPARLAEIRSALRRCAGVAVSS
jgi:CheY-like chemotaxis protein